MGHSPKGPTPNANFTMAVWVPTVAPPNLCGSLFRAAIGILGRRHVGSAPMKRDFCQRRASLSNGPLSQPSLRPHAMRGCRSFFGIDFQFWNTSIFAH
jgi:hypothetical protein